MRSVMCLTSAALLSAIHVSESSFFSGMGAQEECLRLGASNITECSEFCGMPAKLCSFDNSEKKCSCRRSQASREEPRIQFSETCIRRVADLASCARDCGMQAHDCKFSEAEGLCKCTKSSSNNNAADIHMPKMSISEEGMSEMPQMLGPTEMPPMPRMHQETMRPTASFGNSIGEMLGELMGLEKHNTTAKPQFMQSFSQNRLCSRFSSQSLQIKSVAECASSCGMRHSDCNFHAAQCTCQSGSSGSLRNPQGFPTRVVEHMQVTGTGRSTAMAQVAQVANTDGIMSTRSSSSQSNSNSLVAISVVVAGVAFVLAGVAMVQKRSRIQELPVAVQIKIPVAAAHKSPQATVSIACL